MKINTVYNDDCLKVMNSLKDSSIDMVLCDLPYGITKHKWDKRINLEILWTIYKRVLKPNAAVLLFGVEPFSTLLRMSNLKMYRYDWVWLKNQTGDFLNCKRRPMRFHELISVFYQKQPIYNPQYRPYAQTSGKKRRNYSTKKQEMIKKKYTSYTIDTTRGAYPKLEINFNIARHKNNLRYHESEKPTLLLEYFIKTYTNSGDLILDNAAGSGSTAVAAINTNRNFILIEKNKSYANVAKQRIDQALLEKKRT